MSWVRGRELEDGNAFSERIKGHPEPEHLRVTTQTRAHLIELHVWNLQLQEGALLQGLSMRSGSLEPPGDGRMANTKHSLGRRHIQSFCQRAQH